MATTATANYYVRTDGNDANGGGFNAGLAGAGTNYADQASPQLSLTDLACTASSTTVTSATGGFTSAMVGNSCAIIGTGFQTNIYWITGRTDTNTITLDRTPSTAGATGGSIKVGGALLTLKCLSSGGTLAANPNATTTQLVPGNVINIRGSGTNDPSSADYDFSGGYWIFPGGDSTNGPIRLTGYNGRPNISTCGKLVDTASTWNLQNIKFVQTVSTFTTSGIFSSGAINVLNCIFDVNGIDTKAIVITGNNNVPSGVVKNVEIRNSGGGTAGSQPVLSTTGTHYAIVDSCWIHDTRLGVQFNSPGSISNCLINGCLGTGLRVGLQDNCAAFDNTIDGNTGDGIQVSSAGGIYMSVFVTRNLVTNHTTGGTFGINWSGGTAGPNTRLMTYFDLNAFYNNTNNNSTSTININTAPTFIGANDIQCTADPYTNRAGKDFSLNNTAGGGALLRGVLVRVGTNDSGGAVSYPDIGAEEIQPGAISVVVNKVENNFIGFEEAA